MDDYEVWFRHVSSRQPHAWQAALGSDPVCRDRTIRIPTGFGKTAGIVLAWLFNRVVRADNTWPRRLVFCLPMRVLVEQTERAIDEWLRTYPAQSKLCESVGLHVLMGGVKAARWVLRPEAPAILVGTQDMLLSRALNRGYASVRALWPMEHGLLHQDALWVFDEVQLMDVGLATSAQLSAFRRADLGSQPLRPVHTWWMSATLQQQWLETIDHARPVDPPLSIPATARKGGLFEVRKPLTRAAEIGEPNALAHCARERHVPGTLTLIVVNRVATAIAVYEALDEAFTEGKGKKRQKRAGTPDIELVHSRFRGLERAKWADRFLSKSANRKPDMPDGGRIIVATQVVEAGVDISAHTLITELAPWSSLAQRFGRAARYEDDEPGIVILTGAVPQDDQSAAPYSPAELAAADEGIWRLLDREADASPRSLEAFEEEVAKNAPELLARLYPYDPLHVLRRRDLDELFDTSADLSGNDLDVSRFIRSGDARDVTVFWRQFEQTPRGVRLDDPPRREELCPVPIGDIRAWKGKAYVFDYIDGVWAERDPKRLVPGMTVLLHVEDGGYAVDRGWTGKPGRLEAVPLTPEDRDGLSAAAESEDGEDLSIAPWKTVATHGREAGEQAALICRNLDLPETLVRIVVLAARWHDVGKVHEVFQSAIRDEYRSQAPLGARRDLAKAPSPAWRKPPYPKRPGFRHELASTLVLFELLRRRDPLHAALLGPHRELLEVIGTPAAAGEPRLEHPLADEIAALSAGEFDLLAWLVCSHHGKVRCAWTSTPRDQESGQGAIHGVCEGDPLPGVMLPDAQGNLFEIPATTLSLVCAELGVGPKYGASWAERVSGLRATYGPFILTYLEAILRAADCLASMLSTEDRLA